LTGASLDEPVKEGEGPKINGSVMIAVAESKEEVLDKIKADIYYKSGVWDVENVSGYSSRIKLRSCQIRYRADSELDQHLPVQKRYTISFVVMQARI